MWLDKKMLCAHMGSNLIDKTLVCIRILHAIGCALSKKQIFLWKTPALKLQDIPDLFGDKCDPLRRFRDLL